MLVYFVNDTEQSAGLQISLWRRFCTVIAVAKKIYVKLCYVYILLYEIYRTIRQVSNFFLRYYLRNENVGFLVNVN